VLSRIDGHLFGGRGYHLIRGNPDRPNIRYAVLPVASKTAALRTLLGPADLRPAVVFCRTRGRCERTAATLRRSLRDKDIRFYHAGLSTEEKTDLEAWFLASGGGVLVATCAYGMGVDKKDIRTVIHRDLPPTVESYLQESGRAGRDGNPSRAIVLASPREMVGAAGTAGTPMRAITPGPSAAAVSRPGPLTRYLRGDRCRREILVEALGAEPEACSGCDVCDGVARRESPVAEAIVSWLRRRRRRYTTGQAAAVLAGTARTAPVPWHPGREPVFGLLADWRTEEIEEALDELSAAGRLGVIRRGPWKGRLGGSTESTSRPEAEPV
jgi:ATP-dependent DNA helicase RecQ